MKRTFSKAMLVLALFFFPFFVSSCGQGPETGDSSKQGGNASPAPTQIAPHNSLSGRDGLDGEVLAVKIDDTKFARPQIGLVDADLVYIEQVEGGVTRLAAIYSSAYPRKIGPVRSARISDLELLAQFGKVAFAFSGAQRKLRPVIDSANLYNLGAEREGPSVYSRDQSRRPPWNMILNPQALFERAAKRNLTIAQAKNSGWSFKNKTKLGDKALSAEMKWPGARYEILWSQADSGWLINQNGTSKMDASGVPLLASTFVVQVVSITNSEYGDKFGEITPLITSVGEGKAFVFRDGRVIKGTWSRFAPSSGTTFISDSGEEIPFKAGQIWFALVAQEPAITYPPEPSTSPSGQISGNSASASPAPTK